MTSVGRLLPKIGSSTTRRPGATGGRGSPRRGPSAFRGDRQRLSSRRALLLCALLLAGGKRLFPAEALRVLGVGPERDGGFPEYPSFFTRDGKSGISARAGRIDAASVSGEDVILLTEQSLPVLGAAGGESIASLVTAARAGVGIVVIGAAAGALPELKTYSDLLGRKPTESDVRPPLGVVALEVLDQSHPLTQCMTALVFERAGVAADGAVEPLALAVPKPAGGSTGERGQGDRWREALWVREEGKGRIVVIPLDVAPSAPGKEALARREKTALAFLVARSVEWAAGRTTSVRIPDLMPLASEGLGPGDAGIFPGGPRRMGYHKGRQIAPVMGYQAADWLERADRAATELPEKVLDALAIREGSTVADLGAGTGYFALRLARRVGPGGRVFASDLQEEMVRLLRARLEKEGVKNVEAIRADEADPRLPEKSVDLALLVDVYHELSKPAEVLEALRRSLKPGAGEARSGRLVLVEYRGEDPEVPIKPLHRTTVQQIRAEIEPAGFALVEVKGFLPHQHILIFERR